MAGLRFNTSPAMQSAGMRQARNAQQQQQLFSALGSMVQRQDAKDELERKNKAAQAQEQLRPDIIGSIPPEQRTPQQQFIMDDYEQKARGRQASTVDVVGTEGGGFVAVDKLTGQPVGGSQTQGLYQGLGQILPPPSDGVGISEQYAGMSPKTAQKAQEADVEVEKIRSIEQIKADMKAEKERKESEASTKSSVNMVDRMIDLNKGTVSGAYAGLRQPITRITNPDAAKSFAQLRQARLRVAAPLAKQLGVNPTDKDFQNTLDQIFDENEPRETRDAQLKMMREIMLGGSGVSNLGDFQDAIKGGNVKGGLSPEKASRLKELRAKRDRGEL